MKEYILFFPLAAFVVLYFAAAFAEEQGGVSLPYLGQVKPRHAKEIKSSNWSVGAETMCRDYTVYKNWKQFLGPLGAKKARIQSGWAKTEKEKGKYSWEWLDEIIPDMVEQGVEPWVCLCYGNTIYKGGGGITLNGGLPTSPEALDAWDKYVAAFVGRYKKYVDEWEVWNEAQLKDSSYAEFFARTAEVIRREQPSARILGGALIGPDPQGVKKILGYLKKEGKLGLIDEITYHPYEYNPDSVYGGVAELRKVVASFSDKIVIRQGENGAASKRGTYGALSNYDWTEESQAKWAVRRLLGDLGRDIESSYFGICDMSYDGKINCKGLLAINPDKTVHHAKQAYKAAQHVTSIFDDTVQRVKDYECKIEGCAKDSKFSTFGYKAGDGGHIVAIWRNNHKPGQQTSLEYATVTIQRGQFKEPVWVDMISGKVHSLGKDAWTQDGATHVFKRVPVYDSVILIADRSAIPFIPAKAEADK